MKLMIIDGNSIVNRAFYGIKMLTAPDGTPTNGVYGFMTILEKLIADEKPDGVMVAFDVKAKTFRHEMYDGYKAQRKGMPEELAVQLPLLRETLDAMGITRLEAEGWEADDILGTISVQCAEKNWDCVVVTGDKDSFQLISDNTTIKHVKSRMGKTETISYTPAVFREEYGFEPKKIIDLKALMGDSSDNIPGVAGVGEKTASALLQKFGSLDEIYKNIDSPDIKAGVKTKLENDKEKAYLSFDLATIRLNAPVSVNLEQIPPINYGGELYNIFKRLGFSRLITRWRITEDESIAPTVEIEQISVKIIDATDEHFPQIEEMISSGKTLAVYAPTGLENVEITADGETVYVLSPMSGFGFLEIISKIFTSKTAKISHNVKELMRVLLSENYEIENFVFDTALAAYILEPTENNYDLARISAKYLGQELTGAAAIFALTPVLTEKLKESGQEKLLTEMELPLCEVLAEMEYNGFLVDKQALSEFGESLVGQIENLKSEIWAETGEEFNINSPKQLGEVLFEKMEIPHGKKTKTGWSTSAEVLEKLQVEYPVTAKILEYRFLSKLKSTYADGLIKVIEGDGRIHTSFQMTVTATGRLSSTEPNLQNIPIRTKLGADIRKMFVADRGNVLVDADYSQIELRILAHISGDETMINAFISNTDIHTVTASQVFGTPLEEVTNLMRSRAKAVNFGIVYGISAFSLAQDIGVYQNEAKAYIEAYLEKYHGVREYMKNIVEKAKADGFVDTLYNRRRYLPELKSSNFNMRSFGERVALNMPIQGTAADIMKLAMINVYKRLKNEGLKAKLILQVHDELIAECPECESELVSKILTEEMENICQLKVPLIAEAHSAESWFDAK